MAMQTVEVDLGDRTYPIYIGRGLLDEGELLRRHVPGKRALIVTNTTVGPLYLDRRAMSVCCMAQHVQQFTAFVPQGGNSATCTYLKPPTLHLKLARPCACVSTRSFLVQIECFIVSVSPLWQGKFEAFLINIRVYYCAGVEQRWRAAARASRPRRWCCRTASSIRAPRSSCRSAPLLPAPEAPACSWWFLPAWAVPCTCIFLPSFGNSGGCNHGQPQKACRLLGSCM